MFEILCENNRSEFFQWDKDQKIKVLNDSITQVHFCNRTDNCSLVVDVYVNNGDRIADVPNVLLQSAKTIRVYGYVDNFTLVEKRFRVNERTKPTDYVYTETELKTWDSFKEEVTESIGDAVNTAMDERVGDIERALDSIIAIQESILGVSE